MNSVNLLNLWTNFLPVANLVFAIVFVVVIYSTAVGEGLSNYSVKKILPRLIIVAVGVNVSYYVCAFLVDIINIVAVGLPGLIFGNSYVESNLTGFASQMQGLVGGIIGVVLIFLFGAVALVAMLVVILSLVARQVILSALVVISPIAIVCAVLPQTQKWFDKWLKTFVQLLVVYPLFMLVWAATRWFQDVGADAIIGGEDAVNVTLNFIVKSVCTIIPAVAIWPLLKSSGGVMGQITGAINKSPLGTQGGLGKKAQERDSLRQLRIRDTTNRAGQWIGDRRGESAARKIEEEEGYNEQEHIRQQKRRDDLVGDLNKERAKLRSAGFSNTQIEQQLSENEMTKELASLDQQLEQDRKITERRDLARARRGGNVFNRLTGQRFAQRKANIEGAAIDRDKIALADQNLRWNTTGGLRRQVGTKEQADKATARAVRAVNKENEELVAGQVEIINDIVAQAAREGRTNSLEVIKDYAKTHKDIYSIQAVASMMKTQGDPGGDELVNMWEDAMKDYNKAGATEADKERAVALRAHILSTDLAGLMSSKDPFSVEAMKGFKVANEEWYKNSGNFKGIKVEDLRNITKEAFDKLSAYAKPDDFMDILNEVKDDYALNPGSYKRNSVALWGLRPPSQDKSGSGSSDQTSSGEPTIIPPPDTLRGF